jgi:membrane protein DedA with SNARE-associated domain
VLADLTLQPFIEWMSGLGPNALYGLILASSFVEGILPPVPGDVAAAFLAFLSARAGGQWFPTTIAVTLGSVGGNSVVWWLGKRYGARWMAHQMVRFKFAKSEDSAARTEQRIEEAYREYGWVALFLSRFIPGFRAMAPAAAGALRVPLWEMLAILAAAAFLWYSAITWIAFKVGSDWPSVKAALLRFAQGAGLGAFALVLVLAGIVWWAWRRRRARGQ